MNRTAEALKKDQQLAVFSLSDSSGTTIYLGHIDQLM